MKHKADNSSSLEMVLAVTTRVTTGSEAAWTMSSMSLDTDCLPQRLRQRSSSIVGALLTPSGLTPSMLTTSPDQVAEAAVVGINDELTGQAVNAFVSLKDGTESSDQVKKDLILQVRKSIGPFAAPKAIFVVPDLPKTRSGKIMRRIMRKILAGEEDQLGDTSTVSAMAFLCGCWAAKW
jgi:acyl-CoA synthetase (AMP-forming)/AMP-acid ligase II